MRLIFESAEETFNVTLDIDSRTAVTDLTKIEEKLICKDLTDIIQKVLDVVFNVTSPVFTRGPKNAYAVSYSWTLYPVYEGRVVENNAVESISVTVGDSDHNMYEFKDVGDRDVDVMITWLRKEHDIFYAPPKAEGFEGKIEPLSSTFYCCDNKLVTETQRLQEENKKLKKKTAEQQKKIDSYEATLSKITDIMEPKYAGPAWSETWDDLVERIKRMKEKVETLEAENADWMNSFSKAQDSRSAFCKKLKEALNVDYRYPGSFPKMEEDILAEVARLKTEHDWLTKDNANLVCEKNKYETLYEDLKRSAAVAYDDFNEWCRALRNLYEDVTCTASDFDSPPTLLTKRIYEVYKHTFDTGAKYCDKMRELEHKLEDIKDICDGDTDVMNIIG